MDAAKPSWGAPSEEAASLLIGELADELLGKYRRGETPELEEYCRRYPEVAGRIRDLFPTLILMEEACGEPEPSPVHGSALGANGFAEQIGGYRIIRLIGSGGMSLVYEAEHLLLGWRVALKVLPDHRAADSRASARFRREARAVASLHHTNIVPILGVGEDHGRSFFVMPLIEGTSLQQILEGLRASCGVPSAQATAEPGQPPVATSGRTEKSTAIAPGIPQPGSREAGRWVAQVGLQVAEALEHAHSRGVIHRDIKPSNLLIETSGRIWVSDFGLAKTDDDSLTQSGDILGTVRYLAPERFGPGEHGNDKRGDIYALGVTLYEMLTLRQAFGEADRARLIAQIAHAEPPRPSRWYPGISRDLETVVLKAMSKEPAHRYQTASDLASDLRRVLSDQPVAARRPALLERIGRWARRNPTVAGLATALLVLSAVCFSIVFWKWREAESLRRKERIARQASERYAQAMIDDFARLRQANELNAEALSKAEMRYWDDAYARFEQAITLRPDQAVFYHSRGHQLFAHLGLWDLAAADLERSFAIGEPARAWEFWSQALLRLWSNDMAGYRRTTQQARARFLGSAFPQAILETIRTSCLGPEMSEDAPALAAAGERLLGPISEPWHHYVVGIAHLRAGQAAQAIVPLQKALTAEPAWSSRGLVYPALAMALAKNGDREGAVAALKTEQQAFDAVVERLWTDTDGRWVVHFDAMGSWPLNPWDWLEWQLLRREAYEQLGQTLPEDGRLSALRGRSLCGLRWFAQADVEYRRASEQSPGNLRIRMEAHRCHGNLFLAHGQYAAAADEFEAAIGLEPSDCDLQRYQAATYLVAGHTEAYRRRCREMFRQFAGTMDPGQAYKTAFVCTLVPNALEDYELLLPVATLAAQWHPGAERVLGAVAFRAGHFEDALRNFQDAELLHRRQAWDWALIAMIHHRLGYGPQAQAALQSAKKLLDTDSGNSGAWDDRAGAAALVREAENLLQDR